MRKTPRSLLLCVFISVFVTSSLFAQNERREDFAPALSPDGSRLAFYSYRGEALPEIYVLDLPTGEERRLTHNEDRWDLGPAWAPDGNRLYFSSGVDDTKTMAIYSMRPDGTDVRQETHPPDGVSQAEVSFSRDGKWMAYARFDSDGGSAFVLRNRVSGGETAVLVSTHADEQNVKPRLHPAGDQILFASTRDDYTGPFDLYLVEIATRTVKRITETPANERMPMWSSDGRSVLFSSNRAGASYDVYLMPRQGGHARKLTHFDDRLELNSYHSGNAVYFDAGHYGSDTGDTYIYKTNEEGTEVEQVTGKPQEKD